ncbi:hypothetical protein CMV_013861 [Castanea mollissima]|uniref:Uncharacterized protein n=1 Tax=Castanea mollissima TaxID=60419 RepID=A0A8J4RCN9_9ROSI|nr:hypothetical protein CMV_013861 [Castanea mollissima]
MALASLPSVGQQNLVHGWFCNEDTGQLLDGMLHGYLPASHKLQHNSMTSWMVFSEDELNHQQCSRATMGVDNISENLAEVSTSYYTPSFLGNSRA